MPLLLLPLLVPLPESLLLLPPLPLPPPPLVLPCVEGPGGVVVDAGGGGADLGEWRGGWREREAARRT